MSVEEMGTFDVVTEWTKVITFLLDKSYYIFARQEQF